MNGGAAPGRATWRVEGEDEVLHDGFLRVLGRWLVNPRGERTHWELLDVPDTVGVLALTDDGLLVLVREFRPGPAARLLSLPGGMVDPGEDVVTAAARELLEETGYTCREVALAGSAPVGNWTRPRHVALARGCRWSREPQLDAYEDCEPVEMSVADLRRALRDGHVMGSEQAYLGLDHAGLLGV